MIYAEGIGILFSSHSPADNFSETRSDADNSCGLRAGGLPKALNSLGVVIGAAGRLTVVPALDVLVFVFGLGGIVWFVWLGIVMVRGSPSAAAGGNS